MNKELSVYQTCCLTILSILALKFLVAPAAFARFALRDSFLAVTISIIIDVLLFLAVLWVMKRNPNITFKDMVQKAYGKVAMKIINAFLFLYFFLKAMLVIKETQKFFFEALYDGFPWFQFFLPLFILFGFIMNKRLRVLGRSIELFLPLVLLGFLITILLPLKVFDGLNLLPMLEYGAGGMFNAVLRTSFLFGDALVLLVFMGRIKYDKTTAKKIFGSVLFAGVLVIAFFIIFIGVFGALSVNQGIAAIDLPTHAVYPSQLGRIDWLTIIIWTITLVFQAGLLLWCSSESLKYFTGLKNNAWRITIMEVLIIGATIILNLNIAGSMNIATSLAFSVCALAVQVLLPVVLLLAHVILKKKGINTNGICSVVKTPIIKTIELTLAPNTKKQVLKKFKKGPRSIPALVKGKKYGKV